MFVLSAEAEIPGSILCTAEICNLPSFAKNPHVQVSRATPLRPSHEQRHPFHPQLEIERSRTVELLEVASCGNVSRSVALLS